MRSVGPFVSLGGHAIILFWGLVAFAPEPLESDFVEALPVEFVTIAEVTDLTKGVRDAPEVIDSEEIVETPEVASEEISEAPGPVETPVETPDPIPVPEVAEKPVEAKPEEPEPTPPEPIEEVKPEPTPPEPPKPIEEVKPAPVPEPLPEPAPERPKPPEITEIAPPKDPLSDIIEDAPEPEPIKEVTATPEPVKEATAKPAAPSAPAPRLNPRPKVKTAAKKPDLLDKKKPASNAGGKPKKTASKGTSTGRTGAKLTQTELDGLRDAIQRCWSLPPGYSAGRDFQAKVKARLSPDGRLKGRVNVVSVSGFDGSGGAFLVKNAVKVAIEKCQPYKLPANKYSEWENLEVTFYP